MVFRLPKNLLSIHGFMLGVERVKKDLPISENPWNFNKKPKGIVPMEFPLCHGLLQRILEKNLKGKWIYGLKIKIALIAIK